MLVQLHKNHLGNSSCTVIGDSEDDREDDILADAVFVWPLYNTGL
jgi:hypothetical protein